MADNLTLNAGSGGSTLATDDITDAGGAHYQRVKLTDGTANSETHVHTGNGTSTNALRVTVSSDSTGVLSVDDNGGNLSIDLNGTNPSLNTGVVDAGTQRVTLATDVALPAGTNAIGKLAANSGVDIGDVDVTSLDGVAAEGAALGNGILIQGDDGTDRKNINVDPTTGDVQVDVTNTVTVDGSGVTQPVSGTVTANLSATDNAVLDNIDTNTDYGQVVGGGVEATALRVTLASDSTGLLSVDDNGGSLTVDNGGTFAVQVDAALPAGTNAIGKLAANSGVDIGDVDVTSISAGSNLIGDVGISGARTSGGTTLYRNVDVDETEDQVKGTAGQLYWLHAMNLTASVLYLQVYNATAASVTVGTTTPDLTFPLATQGDTNGAGFTLSVPNGIAFGTAITIACTTTVGGSSGPAANGCIVNLGYA